VHYSLDLENFEEILLENLAKIYSSTTFTFHSNFLVPFHSNFWKGIFLLKAQRNWNLYIFNREILSNQQFDSEIFNSLLTECEFNSINVSKYQYKHEMQAFSKLCQENSKNQELSNLISNDWAFDQDLAEFIDENKYHFTRYREFLMKLCLCPSLLALLSPEILENILTSHSDETIFADFINILFQKSLILNVPSLIPSYILKHTRFGKYLGIETLGLLYYYMTDRKQNDGNENRKKSGDELGFVKIKEICEWKIYTFNEINLQNNLNLCSLSCKSNIQKFLMKYWQSFKLKSPLEFYHNKFFEMKDVEKLKNIEETEFSSYDDSVLLNFYEKTQMAFKSFELDTLDDYYGDLIMKIIQFLPAIRKIDLSGLNLGDNFCLMYSDFLILRKIHKIKSNLSINLSNNKRITNVGLKYLYVSFELAYCSQTLNPKSKPKSFIPLAECSPLASSLVFGRTDTMNNTITPVFYGPTIELDLDYRSSNSTTYILDNGLGNFILLKIREYFWAKKKYCFTCEKEVCNRCHKDWSTHEGVENIKCKRPKRKEIMLESSILMDCLKKEEEKKQKEMKKWTYKMRIILYYCLLVPYILDNFIKMIMLLIRFAIIYSKKANTTIMEWLFSKFKRNKVLVKRENQKKKTWQQDLANFVLGYAEDPKEKEIHKFKFNYNVNVLNEYLGAKRIMAFYYVNLLLVYIISVVPAIWFKYYCNIFFGIYALISFFVETNCILRIIKIVNDKSNINESSSKKPKNLLNKFSLKYYLPLLSESILEKYDFFTDVQFCIELFHSGQDKLGYACLSVIIAIFASNIIQLLFFSYNSFISSKEKIGIANENINKFSTLSYLTSFKTIGYCLDLLSTKNATKIGRNYVPQIMVSSVSKCLISNIPQFIIQMVYLSEAAINPVVLYTLISTIISFIGSVNTAIMAKSSILTKRHLKEKFSAEIFDALKKRQATLTLRSEPKSEEIPLENIPVKVNDKYLSGIHEISPFHKMTKEDDTGRELIKGKHPNWK